MNENDINTTLLLLLCWPMFYCTTLLLFLQSLLVEFGYRKYLTYCSVQDIISGIPRLWAYGPTSLGMENSVWEKI